MSTGKFTENEIISILDRAKQSFAVDTEGKVAELLGLGKSALSQQKSRNTLPVDKLVTACSRKGINVNWLLTGEGPMSAGGPTIKDLMLRKPHNPNIQVHSNIAPGPPITRRVPLISNVQAGAWTEVIDNLQPGDAEEWIDITSKVGANAFALRVVGNSMENEFWEGELVIVDPAREAVSGDYVVAKINHDEATFKQLINDGGNIYLRPLNNAYPVIAVPPEKEFRVIGRVVEKVKRY